MWRLRGQRQSSPGRSIPALAPRECVLQASDAPTGVAPLAAIFARFSLISGRSQGIPPSAQFQFPWGPKRYRYREFLALVFTPSRERGYLAYCQARYLEGDRSYWKKLDPLLDGQ